MQKTILGQLDEEDIALWRQVNATEECIKARPSLFSRAEIEQNSLRFWQVSHSLRKKHDIADHLCVTICATTGVIWEDDE